MTKNSTNHLAIASSLPSPQEAFDDVRDSFERFCLLSGIEAMEQMLEEDANALCGKPWSRNKNRKGHYAYLRTDAPSAAVQEMERLARLHDDVMRVLTIKVDEHEEGPSVQMQKRDERDNRRERR